jgi:hypothetical protein
VSQFHPVDVYFFYHINIKRVRKHLEDLGVLYQRFSTSKAQKLYCLFCASNS